MSFFDQVFGNYILWTALLAWFVAQSLKVLFVYIGQKRLDFTRFIGAGGMPSSHSALVASTATMIGLSLGFDTPLFALCVVIACVVTYDASGVRRAAGQQARILNQIVENWGDSMEIQGKRLKELLGHTHFEVIAGIALGIGIALIMHFLILGL